MASEHAPPNTGPRIIHESDYKDVGSRVQVEQLNGVDVVTKISTPESLEREFDILEAIDDPGIPKLISDRGDLQDGRLTMELMPGSGMNEVIGLTREWTSTPLDLNLAAAITSGLADRLDGVRRAGYLYRDLNPAHVLIAQDSRGAIHVSLIDLEASEPHVDGVATVTTGAGSWETLSPEEFLVGDVGTAVMTEASNTYSLGVVLLQLTSGRNPFFIPSTVEPDTRGGKERARFLHQMGLTYLPGEGTQLAAVLAKALHPDPAQRFQTIVEFKAAVEALASTE